MTPRSLWREILELAVLLFVLWAFASFCRAEVVLEKDVAFAPFAPGDSAADYLFWTGANVKAGGKWNWKQPVPADAPLPCDAHLHLAVNSAKPVAVTLTAGGEVETYTVNAGRAVVSVPVLRPGLTLDVTISSPSGAMVWVDKLVFGEPPSATESVAYTGAEYIIVYPRDFHAAAQRLAELRRESKLTVQVICVEDLTDGLRQWLYANPTPPAYLCLLGAGGLDRASAGHRPALIPGVTAKKPQYNAAQYANAITVALDGQLGDLDADGLPDIAIGRIPAQTPMQAQRMVDKIAAFELSTSAGLLVYAERGYGAVADRLAAGWHGTATVIKREAYANDTTFRAAILAAMNTGKNRVAVYVGHGSQYGLGTAQFLTAAHLGAITSKHHFVQVFAACQVVDSTNPDWQARCLGADFVTANGGAVAAWGSVLETTIGAAEEAATILCGASGRLGDAHLAVARARKAGSMPWTADADILLGDPGMQLRRTDK